MKNYLVKYSAYFHYYSFDGKRKSDVRSGEYTMKASSLEEASTRFKENFYTQNESYFVALPDFGWKLTHLEVDKIWEPQANLENVLNGIWTYYDNLLQRVGEGPFGGMDINRS